MLNLPLSLILSSLMFVPMTWAATQIEQSDGQKVIIDKNNARIETLAPNRYNLLQIHEKKAFVVDTKEKLIVEINFNPPANTTPQTPLNTSSVQAKLIKQGKGDKIAGYATLHYQTFANDTLCSDDYFSEAAAKLEDIQPLINAIHELSSSQRKVVENSSVLPKSTPKDPCRMIWGRLEAEYAKLGLQMKKVDHDWGLHYEVLSIKTGVTVAPDYFKLPEGFEILSDEAYTMKMLKSCPKSK
ncbi:MAG: hypothetical protein PHP00_13700 [Thiotrichaceae bacterium]|nr:hypothetical protein [Thiotrichaceae bacterium]